MNLLIVCNELGRVARPSLGLLNWKICPINFLHRIKNLPNAISMPITTVDDG